MINKTNNKMTEFVKVTHRFYSHETYLSRREVCANKTVKKPEHIVRLTQLADYYEEAVGTIIPVTQQWDAQTWADDNNIVSAIQELYGEDSISIIENYDSIIAYLDYRIRKNRSGSFFGSVISIQDIPDSLQRRIWPEKTVEKICKLFLSTCHRLCKEPTSCGDMLARRDFKDSWLYRQVQTWIAEDIDFKYPHKIRKAFMDVTLLT